MVPAPGPGPAPGIRAQQGVVSHCERAPLAESAYPGHGVLVRRLGNPPLLARIATYRLVLGVVAVTVLIAAALAAALAEFAGQGLSHAARRDLAAAAGTSVTVGGTVTAGGMARDTAAVRTAMRS